MSIELSIINAWEGEDIKYIRESLKGYNSQYTSSLPFSKPEPVNLIIRKDSVIIGGLLGWIYWQCCHIDILWIDENYRHEGHGSGLLKKIEDIARENRCKFIHLDTLSFQALEFYKKNGYSVFGELSGYPEDIARYYLKKNLEG